MKPGDTTRSVASMTLRAAAPERSPIAAILPPAIATSPWRAGAPVPSISLPFLIRSSYTGVSSMPDRDLAEVRAALEVSERVLEPLEGKHPVDHRLQPVLLDRPHHRFEPVAMADGDALQPHLACDHQPERRTERIAGQHADHRQRSARPDTAQRLRQRLLAAELDDVVETA